MSTRRIGLTIVLAVAVALAQWEPDVQATNHPGSGKTITAQPAASVDSFVYLVWDDSRDSSGHETYFTRSTDDGTTWLADVRLTPNDNYWSAAAAVAAQGADVFVVWHDLRYSTPQPANEEIFFLRSTDRGATWLGEERLTNDTAHSWHPRIAVAAANLHVVWADYRTGLWQVFYKRSTDAGLTWSDDAQLSRGTGIIEVPEIAVAEDDIHVVWQDSRHGTNNHEVYYIRSTDDGETWGAETRLTNEQHESYSPVMAASGDNVHVVWVDYRNLNSEVFYKHSTDGGVSWSSDVDVSNTASNPSLYTCLPAVAAREENVHVVWADDFDGNDEVYYRRSTDNGSTWPEYARLTNDPSLSASPIVMLTGNEVKVVWPDLRNAPDFELFYKRNPTGNSSAVSERDLLAPGAGFRVSPNPLGAGRATLLVDSPAVSSITVRMYDATGRLVVGPLSMNCGSSCVLDFRASPDGVYLVQADAGSRRMTQKLVVRRSE